MSASEPPGKMGDDDQSAELQPRDSPKGPPDSPLRVKAGTDPSVVMIAFSAHGPMVRKSGFEYDAVIEKLGYSRILLRDDALMCFAKGCPPVAGSADELADVLRGHLAALAPKHTIVIGNSGGSYAAILYGHLLRADYVHAFSPYISLGDDEFAATDAASLAREEPTNERLRRTPREGRKYFDLRQVLKTWNGVTRYNLYACAHSPNDVRRVRALEGIPSVNVHLAPCDSHRIVSWLASQRRLTALLRLETQELVANYGKPAAEPPAA